MRALLLLGCTAAFLAASPAYSQSSSTAKAVSNSAAAAQSEIDPDAIAALRRMSDFLTKLNTFRLTSEASVDVVTAKDQRLQLDAVIKYQARRGAGLVVDFDSDLKTRKFYYDGKSFTIFAPKLGFYATTPAPATNREFLKTLHDKYDISLPLEDLFRWNDGDDTDIQKVTSAYSVGTATIDGASTDHWAFRQKDFDWEVWIERGDRPIPRKLVIIDRTDPAHPGFTARLAWELNPDIPSANFTFAPTADTHQIRLATFEEARK